MYIHTCFYMFIYTFAHCHGESIYGFSEMVSSPSKDPCLNTCNNLKLWDNKVMPLHMKIWHILSIYRMNSKISEALKFSLFRVGQVSVAGDPCWPVRVPEVFMWSFPESCLRWHRWSRRLQLDIRAILVFFWWEAQVFLKVLNSYSNWSAFCFEDLLFRERWDFFSPLFWWCWQPQELGSFSGNFRRETGSSVMPWNDWKKWWGKNSPFFKVK